MIDAPSAKAKDLVAGFWLWDGEDRNEAIGWAKRCPTPMPGQIEIEIRPLQ